MTANTLASTSLHTTASPSRPARDSFWTRIATELADAIGSGTYAPGERLPSEHALAEQFGVNRHTIRRSLASLCSQYEATLRYTNSDDGIHIDVAGVEVFVGHLDERPAEPLLVAAAVLEAVPDSVPVVLA